MFYLNRSLLPQKDIRKRKKESKHLYSFCSSKLQWTTMDKNGQTNGTGYKQHEIELQTRELTWI